MAENNNSDDLLGYGDYADSLWQRIENAVYKDFDSTKGVGDDPLVVGIFGEWGAGKSKLLELILGRAKRKLAEQKKLRSLDAGFMLTIPVFFQPWKYEHEEHLHIPLLMHIFDALKEAIKTGQSPTDYWFQSFGELADKYKTQVPASVKLFEKLLVDSIGVGADVAMPGATKLGLKAANSLAGLLPKLSKPKSNLAEKYKFSGDGHYYRQIHKALKAVTRPNQADNREMLQGIRTTCNPRINFVIFIDDLDRCLPENAVAALELIKTIFNVESFAFVLALDDEIIERGIGHRYKEYKLQDKKPEMPITGFEYLEKIVHLPFRLPAITRPQARSFVQKYEQSIEKDASLRWFDDLPTPAPTGQVKKSNNSEEDMSDMPLPDFLANSPRAGYRADFLELALSGFDAFVPRKLIRLVELIHQITKIAKLKGKPINFAPNAAIDARIVLCLALIQLFQPELFRILRRRTDSFPFLMTAFSSVQRLGVIKADEPKFKDAKLSDIDLWQWAVDASVPGKAPVWVQKEAESIYSYISRIIADVHGGFQSDGADAQQVRLPLVAQLVEHRAVQRHVFDVLKLVKKLVDSMQDMATRSNVPPYAVTFSDYLSLLVVDSNIAIHVKAPINANTVVPIITTGQFTSSATMGAKPNTSMTTSPIVMTVVAGRFSLGSVSSLVSDLMSVEQSVQANLPSRNELHEGRFINKNSIRELVAALQKEFHVFVVREQDNDEVIAEKSEMLRSAKLRLLNGLKYLAPYVYHENEPELWMLVSNSIDFTKAVDPKFRAQWYDVRAALGCDFRFTDYLNLPYRGVEPTDNNGNMADAPQAPAGFVEIPEGKFVMGSKEDADNPVKTLEHKQPFYMSRYPVTVAQYAAFVDAKAYEDQKLWETSSKQGWDWRTGEFDTSKTIEDKNYKDWLARRPADLRHQPMDWAEQLANLNRPVTGVTWFEATAYAAWLELQRQKREGGAGFWGNLVDPKYRLRLPTEGEWERAARAGGTGKFPWDDDETDIDQRANVDRKVGHPTTVGSYPPNALGLYDMAGNVWEWQANLYENQYEKDLIHANTPLKIGKTWKQSDKPSLRGGSRAAPPDDARCSYRGGDLPDYWDYDLGFRLVLSLADFES